MNTLAFVRPRESCIGRPHVLVVGLLFTAFGGRFTGGRWSVSVDDSYDITYDT